MYINTHVHIHTTQFIYSCCVVCIGKYNVLNHITYLKSVHIIHIQQDTQKCVCKSFLKILEKTQTILVFHFLAVFQFHYSYLNCFKYVMTIKQN